MVNPFDLRSIPLEKHAQHVVFIHFPMIGLEADPWASCPNNPLGSDGWGWALFKSHAPDEQAQLTQERLPEVPYSNALNRLDIRTRLPGSQVKENRALS